MPSINMTDKTGWAGCNCIVSMPTSPVHVYYMSSGKQAWSEVMREGTERMLANLKLLRSDLNVILNEVHNIFMTLPLPYQGRNHSGCWLCAIHIVIVKCYNLMVEYRQHQSYNSTTTLDTCCAKTRIKK